MTSGHDGEAPGIGVALLDSLRGLALGDGFGERWFHRSNREAIEMIKARQLPSEVLWYWTDDTAMALTVVRMLQLHGEIRQDVLAEVFGATYQAAPFRGYGYGMTVPLPRLAEDPGTSEQARLSAEVTHAGQRPRQMARPVRATPDWTNMAR